MSKAFRIPGEGRPYGGTAKAALAAIKAAKREQQQAKLELARSAAQRLLERSEEAAMQPRAVKLRKRPKARVAPKLAPTRWNCRPKGRIVSRASNFARERITGTRLFLRKSVLRIAQGPLCALCGSPRDKDSYDHSWPISYGGWDLLGNVVLACDACNEAKANDEPTGCELVFLAYVNARLFGPVTA